MSQTMHAKSNVTSIEITCFRVSCMDLGVCRVRQKILMNENENVQLKVSHIKVFHKIESISAKRIQFISK